MLKEKYKLKASQINAVYSKFINQGTISAMKVTIVSSNIKETFPQVGKTIFVGKWCLKNSEKNVIDYEINKYHWDRENRFYGDVDFLEHVYQEYLGKVTNILK